MINYDTKHDVSRVIQHFDRATNMACIRKLVGPNTDQGFLTGGGKWRECGQLK